MLNDGTRVKVLAVLLRLAGTFTITAFLAMLLPVDWMASMHRSIGLGELPRAPIVEYLARSAAALYGFHGGLLLLISGNPVKHRTIVWYVAAMNVLFGVIVLAIDVHAGMPFLWTAFEGPPVIALGAVLALLNRSLPAISAA